MPNPIAIICSIEELYDYANVIAANTRMFALNISTGIATNAPIPPFDGDLPLLCPWHWKLSGIRIFQQPAPAHSTPIETTVYPQAISDAARQTLEARLELLLTGIPAVPAIPPTPEAPGVPAIPGIPAIPKVPGLFDTPALLVFDPLDPGGVPPVGDAPPQQTWPEILAHASTYPAPLPHTLNLVVFLTVDATKLDPKTTSIFAAPQFSINATNYDLDPTGPQSLNPGHPTDFGETFAWQYTTPGVTVFQPPFSLAAPTQEGTLLDLTNPWINVHSDTSNEDWRTTLEQRIADAFDLPQLTLNALRDVLNPAKGDPSPPPLDFSHFNDLRLTLVSLLRDTCDFGLRYAPDGVNLLRYILTRVLKANPDASFDLEGWLAAAQQDLTAAEPPFTLQSWNTALQACFTAPIPQALNTIPASPPAPSTTTNAPPPLTLATLVDWLEELQGRLADDATLANVLYAGWSNVLKASTKPVISSTWATLSVKIQAELTTLSPSHTLRKRMLQANFGGANVKLATWKALLAPPAGSSSSVTKAQVKTNISDALLRYFHSRIGDGVATDPDFSRRAPLLANNLPTPVPVPLPADFLTALTTKVMSQITTILGPLLPEDAAPSSTPHPVVLQVHDANPTSETNDPLRSIAGVAVLAKETTATDWSCLHTTSVAVLNAGGDHIPAQPVTFVPQRLAERNGVLLAAISYNNQPLIAQSPTTIMAADVPRGGETDAINPMFFYDPIAVDASVKNDTLESWARISGLKFGSDYFFLSFAVRNSGALPVKLAADPKVPWKPVAPAAFTPPSPAPDPAKPTAKYRRRVLVGHLRFLGKNKDITTFTAESLPAIPDTVEPMAKRLLADSIAAAVAAKTLPAGTQPPKLPLLLLWHSPKLDTAAYTFFVRPPSADFQTWDRWVARLTDPIPAPGADPATVLSFRNTRAAVFADFTFAAPKGLPGEQKDTFAALQGATITDATLNDPAVAGIVFQLTRISGVTAGTSGPHFAPVPPPAAILPNYAQNDGFHQVQQGFVKVAITLGADGTVGSVAPDGARGFIVNVPAGQVWKLAVSSAIAATDKTRLEDFMTAADGQFGATPISVDGGPLIIPISQPFEMLIEGARSAALTPQDVWQALQITGPTFAAPSLSVTFDPQKSSSNDWHLVRRTEVFYQAWRWMGRPFLKTDFPDQSFGDLNQIDTSSGAPVPLTHMPDALAWEMESFAERETDSDIEPARPDFGAEPPPANAWSTPEIFLQDSTNDPRAQYFRFSATLYSRYEGLSGFQPFKLLTPSISSMLTFDKPVAPDGKDATTPWKRLFAPCRISDSASVPKPKVLLCIPLLRPLSSNNVPNPPSQPTILVILDEPWFQTGGLAEQLDLYLDSASVVFPGAPGNSTTQPATTLPQLGPDPILSKANPSTWQQAFTFTSYGQPMGTTFDSASAAPLFANTCFRFELTKLAVAAQVGSLDWFMAKVYFIRSLIPERLPSKPTKPIQSLPTESTWIQFLSSSDHFTSSDGTRLVHINDITFTTTDKAVTLSTLVKAGPGPIGAAAPGPVVFEDNPKPSLELWFLLMRKITDVTGHDSEIYVGLYRPGDTPTFQPALTPSGVASLASATHLYLLEVQKTVDDSLNDWIGDLFPPDITKDATHRVVRISGLVKKG
jgi:hypothetical protein